MRITIWLDHRVVGDELQQAWDRTLRVYPLLDLEPDRIDGHLCFFESDCKSKVIESAEPAMPGTDLTARRGVSVSYYDDSITFLSYHSMIDGHGVMMIAKTLLYLYMCIHFNEAFDSTGIVLEENRQPGEYFKPFMSYPLGEYTPVKPYTFPENKDFFSDANMAPEEPGRITVGILSVPASDFIALCKSNKANPTAMLSIIFARAAYEIHQDDKRDALIHLTVDFRPMLGIEDSIAQASSAALIEVPHDEVMKDDLAPLAMRIRSDLNAQRDPDYVKSFTAITRTYDMNTRACSGVISYMGRFELGGCVEHVSKVLMVNNACNILNIIQFGDEFLIYCQLGKAAEAYMRAMTAVFAKMGVVATVAQAPKMAICERR